MRYEDWTFREAEVRLGEHQELRAALGIARTPDYTTLYRFLRRLNTEVMMRALTASADGDGSASTANPVASLERHGRRGRCDGVGPHSG